jgi:hypothetical protein
LPRRFKEPTHPFFLAMILFALTGLRLVAVIVAMLLLIAILLLRSYRYFARTKRRDTYLVRTERPEVKQQGHNFDAPAEVLRWEVHMHETTRDLSAQLDSKMLALQHLIKEADRAADRLEQDMRERELVVLEPLP